MSEVTYTLLGACVGAISAIASAYITTGRQHKIESGCRLRLAFHEELAILRDTTDTSDPYDILKSSFKKHSIAVEEFKYVMRKRKALDFERAWKDYYEQDGHPCLEKYAKHQGGSDLAKKNRNLAIKNIEHILSFTRA